MSELTTIGIVEDGDSRYRLTGSLTFDTAARALTDVGEKISLHQDTTLDLSGVTDANSAGLALLVEWRAIALRSQKTIAFENIPESLSTIAVVCQVTELLH